MECPTKLIYTGKKEYLDKKIDDPFLQALANGGFQVGELAKQYYSDGHDIKAVDYHEAEAKTKELLIQDKVVIFEAAFRYNNLFIRVDILIKDGSNIQLIEVKSKSYDSKKSGQFVKTKGGGLIADWRPYLYDVAFQKYVLSKCLPNHSIQSYLMLVDKNSVCETEGLNQKFKLAKDEKGRKYVKVSSDLSEQDLANKLLISIPVDDVIQYIYEGKDDINVFGKSFEEAVSFLAEAYQKDEIIRTPVGGKCKNCEFKCSIEEEAQGNTSGFKECWKRELHWKDSDFKNQTVLDLWDCRSKDNLLNQGKYKLTDLVEADINIKGSDKLGLSRTQRQWLQIQSEKEKDNKPYIDVSNLKKEMAVWKYPLHFIDFETAQPAIPFHKGMRPYEGIAFQFSHHVVHEDGTIEHAGQYINTKQGEFPNFEFIKHLKAELDKDNGTIFRYADHENTYLNFIYEQLRSSEKQETDQEELCSFIQLISKSSDKASSSWKGERCMVDLLDLVKRYYYDPYTKGSNSLKYVLPAILNSSKYLQEKYSKPIYGSKIKSLNFKDWAWVNFIDGKVQDPYKCLPKVIKEVSEEQESLLLYEEDEINHGGLAMTAYCMMQFSDIAEQEKQSIIKALLQYCELDTLAMVMLYEYLRQMVHEI